MGATALSSVVATNRPLSECRTSCNFLANRNGPTMPSGRNVLINWSRRPDLNRRPADYESAALPTELRRPGRGTRRSGAAGTAILAAVVHTHKFAVRTSGQGDAHDITGRSPERFRMAVSVRGSSRSSSSDPRPPSPRSSSSRAPSATSTACSTGSRRATPTTAITCAGATTTAPATSAPRCSVHPSPSPSSTAR